MTTPNDGTPVTAEEVLLKAADNISKHGHIKGDYGSPDQGFCAMGAIRYAMVGTTWAASITEDNYGLYGQARRLLLAESGGTISVSAWNDADETTGEDVVLAMKRAAHHE